jgi:hypothetical protein
MQVMKRKLKRLIIRDFQIKKYPKSDAKIFSISPLCVLCASAVHFFG